MACPTHSRRAGTIDPECTLGESELQSLAVLLMGRSVGRKMASKDAHTLTPVTCDYVMLQGEGQLRFQTANQLLMKWEGSCILKLGSVERQDPSPWGRRQVGQGPWAVGCATMTSVGLESTEGLEAGTARGWAASRS